MLSSGDRAGQATLLPGPRFQFAVSAPIVLCLVLGYNSMPVSEPTASPPQNCTHETCQRIPLHDANVAAAPINRRCQGARAAGVEYYKPKNAEQVQEIVRHAYENNQVIGYHNTGHNYLCQGWAQDENVHIDVSGLKGIQLNGLELTMGGGVQSGEATKYLKANYPHLGVWFGTCPSVGMVGYLLHGGGSQRHLWDYEDCVSELRRTNGTSCDIKWQNETVTQVEMIIANGTRVTLSDESPYQDLWDSVRHSGPSFGIVTSVTIRLQSRRKCNMCMDPVWMDLPSEHYAKLLTFMESRRLDNNFFVSINVRRTWTYVGMAEPIMMLVFTETTSATHFERYMLTYNVLRELADALDISFYKLLLYNMKTRLTVLFKCIARGENAWSSVHRPSYSWWKTHEDMSSLTRQVKTDFDFEEVALEFYEFWRLHETECILEQSPVVFRLVAVDCFTPESIADLHQFEERVRHKLVIRDYLNLPLKNGRNANFFGSQLDLLRETKRRWDPRNLLRGGRDVFME